MQTAQILPVFLLAAACGLAADLSPPVPLTQTPAAVQKAIAAQIGSGKLEDIFRSDEGGETSFDVGFTTQAGGENRFSVGADGTLLSVEVAPGEAPAAVMKTIRAQAAGWQMDGIDRNLEEGGTTYDVEVTQAGRTQDLTVDDDGTLLSISVAPEETPAAVQSAIRAQAASGQVQSIDKNLDDTEVTFDVETARGGFTKDFTLADDGTLMSTEVALAETPVAAQATIVQQVAGGAVRSIDENFDPDGDTFDVEAVLKDGTVNSFTVGADGSLRSREVTLEQTPAAARKTIQDQIGAGKIIRIDKSLIEKKDKVLPFQVEGRKDGKPFDFSVGPKGRFLGMDE